MLTSTGPPHAGPRRVPPASEQPARPAAGRRRPPGTSGGRTLAAIALVVAVWLGATAPGVSPVAPPSPTMTPTPGPVGGAP